MKENSFLFIIPLTPKSYLSDERFKLRQLCFETLQSQNYENWSAILIGRISDIDFQAERFQYIDFEGCKEEKLQIATDYCRKHHLVFDYIIRLDDDDIFNPKLLSTLKYKRFDLYVDKFQSVILNSNGQIAQSIKYWFPNTCVINYKLAFTEFGAFPKGTYKKYNDKPLLIENEHNDFHLFFNQNHTVFFASKSNPIYLRVISENSITSKSNSNYLNYLNQFGIWRLNNLKPYLFLNLKFIHRNKTIDQGIMFKLNYLKNDLIAYKNYFKLVIYKALK